MTLFLPALAVAFAAVCVWLTVRIVNRRERWAKRTAWALVVFSPALYVLSFGPAFWINERSGIDTDALAVVYYPILRLASNDRDVCDLVEKYAEFGSRRCLLIRDGRPDWCSREWAAIFRLIETLQPDSSERFNINFQEELP